MQYCDLIRHVFTSRHYEAEASTRDRSVREMRMGPHHIKHRFEFRGGVSFPAVVASNVLAQNALLSRLMEKSA